MPAIPVSRRLVGAGLLAAALASGCATTTAPLVPDAIEGVSSAPEPEAPEFIPVVLKRSGYQLCETPSAVTELYALPLPAAHRHLGPMTLRDALLTLAGPAWELHADERARQICFEQPGGSATAEHAHEPPVAEAVQTFPLMPSVSGGQP
jgi:type IV pili sensor histidine kinase/response regulator